MKVTAIEVLSNTIIINEFENPRKLPFSILIIFLTFQFVIGFDFGFHNVLKRKIRRLFKYYSRVIYFVAFIVLGIPVVVTESGKLVFSVINLMQFVGTVISLYNAKYKVYEFVIDVRAIDSNVRSKENFGGVSACAFCLFIGAFNLMFRFLVCFYASSGCNAIDNWPLQILFDVFLMCLDVLHVVQTLVNYYTYCAVKYLKHLAENHQSDINDIRKQFTYIADCCDKIRPLYGNLFLIQLLANVPKLLLIVTVTLLLAKVQVTWLLSCTQAVYAAIVIFQLCSPAVVAEFAEKQMEGVRLGLYTRLQDEKDMEKNLEIVNLLRYMKARPIYNKVCCMFPVNIKLVVVLFSFVSTYLVVIIQFMHIYD